MIGREVTLLKQNIYDLLHNTRISRNGFLFIIVGIFIIYLLGNVYINKLSSYYGFLYYIRYIYKLLGVGAVVELSRRRLHDFRCSGKLLIVWILISGAFYVQYFLGMYSPQILPVRFFERILLVELAIIFIPAALLYFLTSNQFRNKYGDSRVQMVSSTCFIGYLTSKIALVNEQGILEYLYLSIILFQW